MSTCPIDPSDIVIKHGAHRPPPAPFDPRSVDACVMEWVHIIDCLDKGLTQQIFECWTDKPPCASPTVARIVTRYNDSLSPNADGDERRSRVLRQFIHDVRRSGVGSPQLERRRQWAAVDWSLRFATPMLLRRVSCAEPASVLEQMPEIASDADLREARSFAWAVRNKVWDMRMFARERLVGTMDNIETVTNWTVFYEAMAPLMIRVERATPGLKAALWEANEEPAVADHVSSIISYATSLAALNAVASLPAKDLRTIGVTAKEAICKLRNYSDACNAARAVALEIFGEHDEIRDGLNTLIKDLDAEFVGMIRRLCAMSEST